MQAQRLPASRGWRWLAEGWRLFRASPTMWLVLVFAYWLLMMVVGMVPYLGVAAVLILVPGFSVAFMAASRAAERGQPLEMSLIFAGFRENLPAQLILGGVYLASIALLLAASAVSDDGVLARLILTGTRPTPDTVRSDEFFGALVTAALLYMPVMMLFWFAPTLVAWHAMPAAKALFFSLFACLMNWRAFLVYGLATGLVLFVVPFIALLALMLASGGTPRPEVMKLVLPFTLALMPMLYASFYASYCSIFAEQADSSAPPVT